MCVAECHTLSDEIVREIGGHHGAADGGAHRGEIEAQGAERSGDRGQQQRHAVDGVEERPLVVLKILVVAAGKAFDGGDHRHEIAEHAGTGAARELQCVRVPLLRHHRRTGGEGVAIAHETELARSKQDEILGESREMRTEHGEREEQVGNEVAIADGVDAVLGDLTKAEVRREYTSRDGERRAGDRARSEWKHRGRMRRGANTGTIAFQRPEVREHPVGAAHGLRALHVCVGGQHALFEACRLGEHGTLQRHDMCVERRARIHGPQARRCGDLIVAAPAGVQARRHRAR